MKKIVLVSLGVVAVGGIAYLIFMSKKKKVTPAPTGSVPLNEVVPSGSPDTQIPTLSTGGIVAPKTTVLSIEEELKFNKANDIVDKIKRLYLISSTKTTSTLGSSSNIFAKSIFKDTLTDSPSLAISRYKDQLLKLGYEYKGGKNGVLVKL